MPMTLVMPVSEVAAWGCQCLSLVVASLSTVCLYHHAGGLTSHLSAFVPHVVCCTLMAG
jgi:hypothetical protein